MKQKLQAFSVHIFCFLSVFTFGLLALAQEAATPNFELAIDQFIDAVKIGQFAAIIVALVQLMKTGPAIRLTNWLIEKFAKPQVPSAPVAESKDPKDGFEEFEMLEPVKPISKLPGAVTPALSVAFGGLVGVAEAIATGKPKGQAIFEGLLSSGVAMSLYDLAIKPLVKKFTK